MRRRFRIRLLATPNDKPKVTNTVNVYPPEPNTPLTTPTHTAPPTTPHATNYT